MAATVTISESNQTGEVVTNDTTNVNMGSTDAVDLNPTTYPITAGQTSYQKYNRFRCASSGGSSKLKTFKVWASATLSTNCELRTNVREEPYTYYAATYPVIGGPKQQWSATVAWWMGIATPASPNLGYGGSLSGEMDLSSGLPKYTDYAVMLITTTGAAVAGTTVTMNYQYDEVA